jgi:hypothetical protein
MGRASLVNALREIGLDASSLAPLEADSSITTMIVPGEQATFETWNRLRIACKPMHCLPIICGEAPLELTYLNRQIANCGTTTGEILATVSVEPPRIALLKEQLEGSQRMLKWYRSQGREIPSFRLINRLMRRPILDLAGLTIVLHRRCTLRFCAIGIGDLVLFRSASPMM